MPSVWEERVSICDLLHRYRQETIWVSVKRFTEYGRQIGHNKALSVAGGVYELGNVVWAGLVIIYHTLSSMARISYTLEEWVFLMV